MNLGISNASFLNSIQVVVCKRPLRFLQIFGMDIRDDGSETDLTCEVSQL